MITRISFIRKNISIQMEKKIQMTKNVSQEQTKLNTTIVLASFTR